MINIGNCRDYNQTICIIRQSVEHFLQRFVLKLFFVVILFECYISVLYKILKNLILFYYKYLFFIFITICCI
jgi:hypothetical protein